MLSKLLKKTEVKKNLTISVIGTAAGQLIHLGTTPIISRIYSPELFGQYSLFLSFLGVFTAISLCKFDLAIIAVEDDEVSFFRKILFKLSVLTTLISTIVLIFLYFTDSGNILSFLFLTLTIPVSAKYWMHRSILNKSKLFKNLSIGKVLENSSNGLIAIGLGLMSLKDIGLFAGKFFALLFSWLYFRIQSSKLYLKKSILPPKDILKKYINYPKYSFPAELVGQLNLNTIIFIFAYLFSPLEVGLIGLTTRVMSVPANFVSISFLDVFKQKSMQDFKDTGSFRTIFIKFFFALSAIAISMITVIYFTGPSLFNLVFGNEWGKAGIYAQYLCFFYAIRLVTGPLAYALEIVNKHYINLIFQCLYLITGVASILGTFYITGDDLLCIKVYSFSLFILYAIHTTVAFKYSKKVS